MSAERQVFKKIDQLVAQKEHFDALYKEQGTVLLKAAFTEFMQEHPEVEELRTTPTTFTVKLVGSNHWMHHHEIVGNPQLSKCLQALEEKVRALQPIYNEYWGASNPFGLPFANFRQSTVSSTDDTRTRLSSQ